MRFLKTTVREQNSVILGTRSDRIFDKREKLSEAELNHHVHVVGASGFGKTVLLSHIIKQRAAQGKGLLFIDLKGDISTVSQLTTFMAQCNRLEDVHIFSLSDQKISLPYNLILDGTATQLRDRIMMSLTWSEEFYKNQSASFLLKVLIGLCYLRDSHGRSFHLGTILDCLNDPEKIAELSLLIPESSTRPKRMLEECYSLLNTAEGRKSLQGLRTQIESLALSDFGDLVASNEPGINLFQAITQGKIVFIFLDTRRYGETAKAVGRFILQDLKAASARIDAETAKKDRKIFSVIIDEFADLAQEDFISFLDRARSVSLSIVVAHQEICDLERISPEFAGRLMGNTSTLYAFLQKRPESAEIISGMAGTRTVWKHTKQTKRLGAFHFDSGNGSKREVEEFNIHPNLIKSLGVGKCVCVKKYPRSRSYLVKVDPYAGS